LIYAQFRQFLEDDNNVEWPFEFWDSEEKCRMNPKLESFNPIAGVVTVIPANTNPYGSTECRDEEEVHILPNSVPPLGESRESSTIKESAKDDFASTLVLMEVMDKYIGDAEKLRKELKHISLDDHTWTLHSRDSNGVGVVHLWCGECDREFGGKAGDHSKIAMTNLFTSFSKKHIMFQMHVKNWCHRKGIPFECMPVTRGKSNKLLVLTNGDLRNLVAQGVSVLFTFNSTFLEGCHPFVLVGNPEVQDLPSFWYKVRCVHCHKFLQLCPPKRNLAANLQNHVEGTRHVAVVAWDATQSKTSGQALSIGRKGHPSSSSTKSIVANQGSLYGWFTSSGGGTPPQHLGLAFNSDSIMKLLCWGYWKSECIYKSGGFGLFQTTRLILDTFPGGNWAPEPHTLVEFDVPNEHIVIKGTFRHSKCLRLSKLGAPFLDFMCSNCAHIPQEHDFRMRLLREDTVVLKGGERTIGHGIRLGYLQSLEVTSFGRTVSKK
jgi:hypothetical protein